MKPENIFDIIDSSASKDTSGWSEKASWRELNEAWLDKSADIAIKVLRALKAKSMTQKDLAEMLNVTPQQISKIVKGKENLTLSTICKLEYILDLELVSVSSFHVDTELEPNFAKSYYEKSKLFDTVIIGTKQYESTEQYATYQPSEYDYRDRIAA